IFVGAGDGPCVLLAASSQQFQKDGPWGFYCVDAAGARHGASPPEETQDTELPAAPAGALPRRAAGRARSAGPVRLALAAARARTCVRERRRDDPPRRRGRVLRVG